MNWNNKKVLVAGGAGMIGSHLARRLCSMGSDVTIVDNLSSGSRRNIKDIKDSVRFKVMDLRSPVACRNAVKGQDVVFGICANMGGIGYITQIGADIMYDNIMMNMHLLDASRKAGVEKYFYSSSACIYPEYKQTSAEVVPLKEEDAYPAMPDQFYGWEKLFAEQYCLAVMKDYGKDMDIKIGRFHNIYGDGFTSYDQQKGKAPCHLIIKAIRYPEQPFVIWGDGRQTRSFCYIEDCIDAVLKLMDSDFNDPINIGTDRLVTIQELADIIAKISGKVIKYKYDLTKPQGVRGRNADLKLCEEVLDWRPKVDLEEGLTQVYQWAVQNYERLEGI